jgi:SOS response regulatory protein OraA/RecX
MQIELEKNKLLKFLTAFGLSDKQIKDVLYEFERQNNSLSAENFVKILERLNYPKATIISLLREMGAEEEDLLELFSHISSEEQISFELKKAESTKK